MRRRSAVLGGLAAGMLPVPAMAQAAGGSVTSFGAGDWFGLMLRLGLVVGVIWAAVYAMRWYTRRAGGERGGAARTLDIVETRSLGPNRALHLVRIGGRAVLIGVTPERINALLEINDPEVLDHLELSTGGSARPAPNFGALLAGFGAGGHASKADLPEEEPARAGQVASLLGSLRGGLRRPMALAAPRQFTDRVLALLGFIPVESIPQTVERMRAARLASPAMQTSSWMSAAPAAPVSRDASTFEFSAPVVAPSATQALRALSGYRATQESLLADPQPARTEPSARTESLGREERIAEAQRAIAAARQKAG